jgi:hypothetical protein
MRIFRAIVERTATSWRSALPISFIAEEQARSPSETTLRGRPYFFMMRLRSFSAAALVSPKREATHTTHALAPEAVLDVYARLLARTPPPSFALSVCGERFELGEGLSPQGASRLEDAWAFVQGLMEERSVESWRCAARGC